jgi:hypothetical protein
MRLRSLCFRPEGEVAAKYYALDMLESGVEGQIRHG